MINRQHPLPVVQQCKILAIARSSFYYTPQEVSAADLVLMQQIDRLHLEYPFAGSRMLRDLLRQDGINCRAQACGHLDAKNGHRGSLPASSHHQAAPRTQGVSVLAA